MHDQRRRDDVNGTNRRLDASILYSTMCRPETDYQGREYGLTDLVIDVIRSRQKARGEPPDKWIRLRDGGKAECEARKADITDPRRVLFERIIGGIEWRRDVVSLDIKTRQELPLVGYTSAKAVSDAIQYHNVTSIIDGLIGARGRQRLESELPIADLYRVVREAVECRSRCEANCISRRLEEIIGHPELERYLRDTGNAPTHFVPRPHCKQVRATRN